MNDANQQVAYGRIQTFIRDASDGTEDGTVQINHFIAGSEVNALELDNDEYVFNNGSYNVDFRVESDALSHMFFVDASENGVGIGDGAVQPNGLRISSSTGTTNAVDVKLYLNARSSGTTTTGFGPGIVFAGDRNGDGGTQQMAQINAVAEVNSGTTLSSGLSFQTATAGVNSAKMTINNLGSVGIGVADGDVTGDGTSARTYVGIIGTANRGRLNLGSTASNGADAGSLAFTNGANTLADIIVDTTAGVQNTGTMYLNGTRSIKIQTAASDEATFNESGVDTDFRVESDGNANMLFVDAGNNRIGIGKSDPARTLDLHGSMEISVNTASHETFIFTTGAADDAKLLMQNASAATTVQLQANGDSYLKGGNLGLGVTPDTFSSGYTALQINGYAYNIGHSGGDHYITNNAYFNSGWKYGQTSTAQMIELSSGQIQFKTVNSGSADSAITWVRSMNVLDGGGVIVNEDSVDMDFRVESNGNSSMIRVDGGNNRIGFGFSNPAQSFAVQFPNAGAIGTFFDTGSNGDAMYNGAAVLGVSRVSNGTTSLAGPIFEVGRDNSTNGTYNVDKSLFTVRSDYTVINEDGEDYDFRVESDNNANMIFLDASSDQVNFGTSLTTGLAVQNSETGVQLTQDGRIFLATGDHSDFNRTANGEIIRFRQSATQVGSISVTASATAFNTSSDARLKENIADADDAGELIDAIQVRQFDWIADGEHQRYGLVAQELNTVAPEAVSEGETEDDMMAVDYSKLVPMLVKEIQSLRARVAQLENT